MDRYNNLKIRFFTLIENYKKILSVSIAIMLIPAFLTALEKKDTPAADINTHIRILKDKTKEWKARAEAALAIGNSMKKEGILPLKEGIKEEEHWGVRQNIVKALTLIGEEGVVDILINTLSSDGSPLVRAEAAKGLGEIGDKKGVNALNKALKDEAVIPKITADGKESVQVRVVAEAAEAALKKIEGSKVAIIPQGKEKKDAEKKGSAAKNPAAINQTETVKGQPQKNTDKKDGVITVSIKRSSDVTSPWVVNLASYLSKENAKSAVDLIRSGGYKPYLSEIDIKGNHWYRLRVGFFKTEADARVKVKEIEELYNMYDAWISKLSEEELANEGR